MNAGRGADAPDVSILVLTYRHASYIRACLIGLAHLDHPSVEIILLDDGSPDDTVGIAHRASEEIGLDLTILEQPNSGGKTAANINRMLDASRGRYVSFMSGDDILVPGYPLAAIVASLEADGKLDMVMPQRIRFGADATKKYAPPFYHKAFLTALKSGSPVRMVEDHLCREGGHVYIQGMVVRRDAIEAAGAFDTEVLADDYAFVFRLLTAMTHRGSRFRFEESGYWLYRAHPDNLHNVGLRQALLILEVVAKYVPSKLWRSFRWRILAMSTLDELRSYRTRAVELVDPKTAIMLVGRTARKTVRQARRRGDKRLLSAIASAADLSPATRISARFARWRLRIAGRAGHRDRNARTADSWEMGPPPLGGVMRLKRSAMKRLVRHADRRPDRSPAIAAILERLGYGLYPLAAVEDDPDAVLAPVWGRAVSCVSPPRTFDATADVMEVDLPVTRPLVIRDALVRADSSMITAGRRHLMPRKIVEDLERLSLRHGRDMFDHRGGGRYVMASSASKRIPEGICAFGSGATNWYHWLIETLPMVMLAGRIEDCGRDVPLLVPREVAETPNFRSSLDLFADGRPIVPLDPDRRYCIGRMIHVPPPVFGPIQMVAGQWPEPRDYIQNVDVMRGFRAEILDRLDIRPGGDGPRRIFLSRLPGTRSRPYNAAEIERVAMAAGFERVFPERMTFREQVQTMQDAEFVVGPTGAAWTNSLFMRPGSRSLIWAIEVWGRACTFSNLALISGSDMTYLLPRSIGVVKNMNDAHTLPYHIPVEDFAAALDRLLVSGAVTR